MGDVDNPVEVTKENVKEVLEHFVSKVEKAAEKPKFAAYARCPVCLGIMSMKRKKCVEIAPGTFIHAGCVQRYHNDVDRRRREYAKQEERKVEVEA